MTSHLLDLLSSAGPLALLVVMAVVLVETGLLLGVALPGDSLLFGTGLLAATGVIHLPVALVMAAVALAAFAGDQLGYTIVRTVVPVVAGMSSMDRRRFAVFNGLGALMWGIGIVGAGYLLGGVPFVVAHVELCALAAVLVSLLPVVWHAHHARSVAASSDAMVPAGGGRAA